MFGVRRTKRSTLLETHGAPFRDWKWGAPFGLQTMRVFATLCRCGGLRDVYAVCYELVRLSGTCSGTSPRSNCQRRVYWGTSRRRGLRYVYTLQRPINVFYMQVGHPCMGYPIQNSRDATRDATTTSMPPPPQQDDLFKEGRINLAIKAHKQG